jgi:hypothetical protein
MVNFELLPRPADERTEDFPWPTYPRLFKVDYGHGESAAQFGKDPREYSIMTKEFLGKDGKLTGLKTVRVKWEKDDSGKWNMSEVPWKRRNLGSRPSLPGPGLPRTRRRVFPSLGVGERTPVPISRLLTENTPPAKMGFLPQVMPAADNLWWFGPSMKGAGAAREMDKYLMGRTNLR